MRMLRNRKVRAGPFYGAYIFTAVTYMAIFMMYKITTELANCLTNAWVGMYHVPDTG